MLIETIARGSLELKDHTITKANYGVDGSIELHIRAKIGRKLPCSCCGKRQKALDKLPARTWTHLSILGTKLKIIYQPRRVRCCQKRIVEKIPWSIGKCQLTIQMIMAITIMAELLPWKQVAELFHVHWNTIRNAVQYAVSYGLATRKMGSVLYFGIDEISRKKGHVYCTNVYDLETKRLLWTGKGRSKATLDSFYEEVGSKLNSSVVAICCDMWQPYIDQIKNYYPNAVMVFDKFHIIAHLNKAIDEVRKQEARELKGKDPGLLKGTRYIWLKNPENLTVKQRVRLSSLVKLNLKINRAYILKEAFSVLWKYNTRGWARRYLKQWFWWATHSRLKPLRDFAWMLRRHEEGILNYFKVPISNGIVEGLNNKAKVISHRAYGFRTFETYRLALYHGMGKLPKLIPGFKFL